jgi:hypothetical protein
LGVPSANRFQIVAEQDIELVKDSRPLAGATTKCSAIVMIYLTARYSGRKTRALFGRITELLDSELQIQARDVVIGLVHVAKENWSFGYAEAQFLETLPHQFP